MIPSCINMKHSIVYRKNVGKTRCYVHKNRECGDEICRIFVNGGRAASPDVGDVLIFVQCCPHGTLLVTRPNVSENLPHMSAMPFAGSPTLQAVSGNPNSLRTFREEQIPYLFVVREDLVFLLGYVCRQCRVPLQDRSGLVDKAGECIVDKTKV